MRARRVFPNKFMFLQTFYGKGLAGFCQRANGPVRLEPVTLNGSIRPRKLDGQAGAGLVIRFWGFRRRKGGFVENDRDLYPIIARAKDNQLKLLATIISQKVSSSIDDGCRSPQRSPRKFS